MKIIKLFLPLLLIASGLAQAAGSSSSSSSGSSSSSAISPELLEYLNPSEMGGREIPHVSRLDKKQYLLIKEAKELLSKQFAALLKEYHQELKRLHAIYDAAKKDQFALVEQARAAQGTPEETAAKNAEIAGEKIVDEAGRAAGDYTEAFYKAHPYIKRIEWLSSPLGMIKGYYHKTPQELGWE